MNRLPFIFILLTLMIDAIGIGLILPVLPSLIREVTGGDLSHAALWGGVLSTSFAVMQVLCGPTVGNLSDRFGRKPVLLASLLVVAADYLVMALAGTIWLLLVGRVVGGIASATQSTANAYIADISTPDNKAANFGLVGAAFGVGFIIGPVMGGLLAEFGARVPFYVAGALALANAAFGWVVLRETVTDAIRRPFSWARANPFGAFGQIGRMAGAGRLLVLFFLYEFAFIVYPAVWAYFGQERFGWSPRMVGLSLASFGISLAVVQGGLIKPLMRRLGEAGTVVYGLIFNLGAFLCLALVTDATLALILTPLTALGAVVTPALMAMISGRAGKDQQGEVQGIVASVRSVAWIASPLAMTLVFSAFTRAGAPVYLPGAPFLLSAGLMVVCGAVFWPVWAGRMRAERG